MTDERLNDAFERLLAGSSPREMAGELDEEERHLLRMAQLLRGSVEEAPRPEFVARVRRRLSPRRISRRTAVASGLGAIAASLVAGVAIERATDLVGDNGHWVAVAKVSELPEGAVRTFDTGGVQGFLMHRGGQFRALSRICTHMGCTLQYDRAESAFTCPCHGAEFDLTGRSIYGPGGYTTSLPRLPRLKVRVNGDAVEVWGV